MRTLAPLGALVGLLMMPVVAGADLIGVGFGGNVFRINETTGVGVTVGSSGFATLNSLASNSSGVLYSAEDDPSRTQRLVTINPATGAGTAGAVLNFGAVNPDVRALAFSPSDVLFAANNTGPIGQLNPDDIFTINVATGVATLVGPTGRSGIQGLDFGPGGVLYGWDVDAGLVTINTSTGVATDVNPLIEGTSAIQSIVFTSDGRLFGAREALFTISPATGAFSVIGSGGYTDVRGIEIFGPAAVPEPSALLLIASPVAALAMYAWRRRRVTA
jgi:hypothetical protein